MKTGRYRVRRGFRGKAVLQLEIDSPSLIGGQIASDVRELIWRDVDYDTLESNRVALIDLNPPGTPKDDEGTK